MAVPHCLASGLFACADVLRAANVRAGRPVFSVDWVSSGRGSVTTSSGQLLTPTARLRDGHDAYVLPGLWVSSEAELNATYTQTETIAALAALPKGAEFWAYCAGVPLVAAATRLNGRAATATWWMQPFLEAKFPRVRWQFSEPLVSSGPVVTASGAHGYLPLILAQLERWLDPVEVNDVRDFLMLPQPRITHPLFRGFDVVSVDEGLRPLYSAALKTPASVLSLQGAAVRLGVSTRTLSRRVEALSGLSAGDWLRRIKLKQAADELTRTPKSVKQVSLELGFSSEAAFHRTFRSVVGVTPLEFRRRQGAAT